MRPQISSPRLTLFILFLQPQSASKSTGAPVARKTKNKSATITTRTAKDDAADFQVLEEAIKQAEEERAQQEQAKEGQEEATPPPSAPRPAAGGLVSGCEPLPQKNATALTQQQAASAGPAAGAALPPPPPASAGPASGAAPNIPSSRPAAPTPRLCARAPPPTTSCPPKNWYAASKW